MSYNTDSTTLIRYIGEVSELLPNSHSEKHSVLDDLREDLQEALNSDLSQDLNTSFGSPREAARNSSKRHDWKIRPAGWLIRTLAFLVDFLILLVFAFTTVILSYWKNTGLLPLENGSLD